MPEATPSAQAAARQMDAELRRIERAGIRAGNAAAITLRADVLRAWLRGSDPEKPIKAWQKSMASTLGDAMATGYLQGRLRARATARRKLKGLSLARSLSDAMDDFGDRLGLNVRDVESLAKYFTEQATTRVVDAGGLIRSKVADAVAEAIKSGDHVRKGAGLIREAMDASGVTSNNPYLAETLYRTSLQESYAAARWQANQAPEIQDILWGYEYASTLDDRTTDLCLDLDGTRRKKDDAFWDRYTPPNHWNAIGEGEPIRTRRGCVPIESVQLGDEVWTHKGRWRRVYGTMNKRPDKAAMRELFLATGGRLLVTDEHPVLTCRNADAGFMWKRAGDLQVGDVLCQYAEQVSGSDKVLLPDPKDCPSEVNEECIAWDVVSLSAGRSVPLAVNLKIDAVNGEREVETVPANCVLESVLGLGKLKQSSHDSLTGRCLVTPSLRPRLCRTLRNSTHMHWVPLPHPLGRVRPSLAPTPVQISGAFGDDGGVAVCDLALIDSATDGDAMPLAEAEQSPLTARERSFDGTHRLPVGKMPNGDEFSGGVDRQWKWIHATIICIAEVNATPRVYNLAVEDDETYVAGGVIVHNCRASIIEVFTGDEEARSTPVPRVELPGEGFQDNPGAVFKVPEAVLTV